MRFSRLSAVAVILLGLIGCHSAFVDAALLNRTSSPIPLIEVDYPSASFGTQNLAPGADFHYRFKVLGEGPLKVVYTDNAHHDHSVSGPTLREGDEGPMTLTFAPDGIHWQTPSAKH